MGALMLRGFCDTLLLSEALISSGCGREIQVLSHPSFSSLSLLQLSTEYKPGKGSPILASYHKWRGLLITQRHKGIDNRVI
jgi:hypothetical protein